jgi:glycosyltransferase involved in cell wall biosynthesis
MGVWGSNIRLPARFRSSILGEYRKKHASLEDLMNPTVISVILPVYNEGEIVKKVYEEIKVALDHYKNDYEIIFVNDGSGDDSGDVLDSLAAADGRAKIIHFRRNFGQTAALMAGIRHASGSILVPMDADGQNDPADIPRLVEMLEEGYDVVSGWRRDRKDRALSRRLPSQLANRLISGITGVQLHDYGCTLKAYRSDVLDRVNLYGEMHRFIPVHASWNGARVTELAVNHRPRTTGRSKYGIDRVPRVLLDAILLYFLDRALDRPLQFFGKLGLLSLVAALGIGGWAIVLKIMGTSFIQTPLPLLVVLLLVLAVLCVLLGLLAELLSRIYFETQDRTVYVVRQTRNLSGPTDKDG